MLAQEARCAPVREYLSFCGRARTLRGRRDEDGLLECQREPQLGHDRWSVGWAGGASNLLNFASYSYALESYGIRGACWNGGSSRVHHRVPELLDLLRSSD